MPYQDYIQFLSALLQEVEHLTEIGQQKYEAAQNYDLDKINEYMKQEQAISLTLRGMDQKRIKLLKELGCEDVPLRDMPNHCPEEYRQEIGGLVERLLRAHQVLRSTESLARTIMEQDLRGIQQELEARGVVQDMEDNYQAAPGEPPAELRTDIRI